MKVLLRFTIGLTLVLASASFTFAQTNDGDVPLKLQKLAAELGCKTKLECRKIFDANFERGVQLAEQYRVYNPEQQKLAKTFKESVLQKLSSVPAEDIERTIVDVARGILEKNSDLAKRLKLNEERVRVAEGADGMKRLARDLAAGKYPELGRDPDSAGAVCLRPASPTACDEIAQNYFGPEGVAELARARSGVAEVVDVYQRETESLELQLPDGRILVGRDEIRRRCDSAFQNRDVSTAEACGRFAVSHGFAREDDVRRGLEFLRGVEGPSANLRNCDRDPESCAQYLPEAQRAEFAAMRQLEEIMQKYIGFSPRECSRGDTNPEIGQRCFEGSKKAISEIDSLNLAVKSPEVARIVAEIKSHIREGEESDRARETAERVVRAGGGPGGCKTEAECSAYCVIPANGPECIAFGGRVGVFRPEERLLRYEQQYQRAVPEQRATPVAGPSPECFQAIQDGDFVKAKEICRVVPAPIVSPPQPIIVPPPPQDRGDICPSLSTVDTCLPGQVKRVVYSSLQCGVYYGCAPDPFAKQCPEEQYWVEASDGAGYCKPKVVQDVVVTPPPPVRDNCSDYGYGWHRMESETGNCYGPEMREFRVRSGVRYECGKQSVDILAPGCAPRLSPTQCLQGQYWNGSTCVATGTSASACDIPLKNLLGDGCHYMYNDVSEAQVFCNGPMTMSAKRGDAATTPGCQPPSGGGGGGGDVPPSSQRQQVWNNFGLQSWVRADADNARIEQLKQICSTVPTGANIWMPGAGDPTSANFGMPDPVKCPLAAACTTGQYFDGARCIVTGGGGGGGVVIPPSCLSGQYWNGTACVTGGGGTPPAGQREQVWNALGLRSWVRTDADQLRVDSLRSACTNVSPSLNVWMASAGNSASLDFGMPDPAKCQAANACTTGQYFNGTQCVTGTPGFSPASSCSAELTALLGNGCHIMGGGTYFNGEMTRWVLPPATVASECTTSYVAGCTTGTSGNQGQTCPAGQSWNGTACAPIPGATACPADVAPLLGSGCHNMPSGWFNGAMDQYVLPGTTVVQQCSTNYVAGCTVGAPQSGLYYPLPLANIFELLLAPLIR